MLLVDVTEPFAPGELEAYSKRLAALADGALRDGKKQVVIVTSEITMSAAGRGAVAEAHKKYLTQAQIDVNVASMVVMTSALQRGILTAFRWIFPEIKSIRPVASMDEAFAEAMRVLDSLGTPFSGDREALRAALGLTRPARAARP